MRAKLLGLLAVPFVCALAAHAADPCTLLTPAQVGGALGTSVGAGHAITPSACEWTASKSAGRVTFGLQSADGFAMMKTPLPGITKVPAGVGDDSFYATVGHLTSLSVKKGAQVFIVHVYGVPGEDKQKAIEKTLALDILAKL